MHIELTGILTCPRCGPGHGLIAFVDRVEGRRIAAGRLDCPMCERRHAVRDGILYLAGEDGGEAGPTPSAAGDVDDSGEVAGGLADPAPTAAALLGPPGGPETLLVAGGAESLGPALAELRPDTAVVTYGRPPTGVHARVYAIVPSAAGSAAGESLPLRSDCLDGAVLSGAGAALVSGVARALKSGARIVVLGPAGPIEVPPTVPLRQLAADVRAWVGARV